MRGLETRALLARARIMFLVDAAAANAMLAAVRCRAMRDGWQDAAQGIASVPVMFRDEANLEHNWALGQACYHSSLAMAQPKATAVGKGDTGGRAAQRR